MNLRILLVLCLLSAVPSFGCPVLSLDYTLDVQTLKLSFTLEPEPYVFQIYLELVEDDTVLFSTIMDNSSLWLARPAAGDYIVTVQLLYPSCNPKDSRSVKVPELYVPEPYRSTSVRLTFVGLWLLLSIITILALILIIRR